MNILYCVVGSLILVGINIVVCLVKSEGIDTGYGDGCWPVLLVQEPNSKF